MERVRDLMWSCRKSRRLADSEGLKSLTDRAMVGLTKRTFLPVT